jgi:hypothetical protein
MDVRVRLFCVEVEAMPRADPQCKESYRLCMDSETGRAAKVQQRTVEPYRQMDR